MKDYRGLIFAIKRDCHEDGYGIRTTVFFKGCPLDCIWCHNPEGKLSKVEVAYTITKCNTNNCNIACIKVCPNKAISQLAHHIIIDKEKCLQCGQCVKHCTTKALHTIGQWLSVDEIMAQVMLDIDFYHATGGGVTFSGGEPTQQMEFVHKLSVALKRADINLGIETCGYFDFAKFSQLLLPYLDFIYFDLKLIDETASRKYTGRDSKLIIANFRKLHEQSSVPVITRIPLIPEITTTKQNLHNIAALLHANNIPACVFLPYNPTWHHKALELNKPIQYTRNYAISPEEQDFLDYLTLASD